MKVNISFSSLLGIVFIILKLTNVIDWSWWWVTCPLWIGLAITLIVGIIIKLWALIMGWYYKATNNEGYLELQRRMKELEGRKSHITFFERLKEVQEARDKILREKQENNNK